MNSWCQINVRFNKCIYNIQPSLPSFRILTTSCCQVQCIWSAWFVQPVQPGVQWPCLDPISYVWTLTIHRVAAAFVIRTEVVCPPCPSCRCCRRGFHSWTPGTGPVFQPAIAAPLAGHPVYTGPHSAGCGECWSENSIAVVICASTQSQVRKWRAVAKGGKVWTKSQIRETAIH